MKEHFKSVEDEIKYYKEEIGKRKADLSRTEGELSSLMKQLEEEFGIKTIEDAKKLLKSLELKISKINLEMEKEKSTVKEALDND